MGKIENRWLPWLIGAATVSGIVMAIVAPVDGDDASFHLHWIPAFYALLHDGVWLPKWLPDGFHGFGAPTFYFYPPLTNYISSLAIWITGVHRPEAIFNLVALFSTLASGAACYYLLNRLGASRSSSILGSLFYAFAPYRQFDLYTRSSLSQPMGFIFLPLILAGLIQIVRSKENPEGIGRIKPNVVLALSWAGLLLCAFPLALAAAMTIVVMWFAFRHHVRKEHLIPIGVSLLLGTGITAFHYIPSLHFMPFVQSDLYLSGIPDGNWVPALLRGTQLRFVTQDMLIYGTQIALLIWCWRASRGSLSRSALTGVATVLTFFIIIETPFLSSPLWDYVPLFHVLRFHARFSIFAVLALTVIAFEPGFQVTLKPFARRIAAMWSVIAVLLSLTVIFHIQGHQHGTSLWMDPPEYLPKSTVPAKVAMEDLFLPHVHDLFSDVSPELTNAESVQLISKTARNIAWSVHASSTHRLTLHQFAWPEWKCLLDGQSAKPEVDSIGRMVIDLKPGSYKVTLELVTSTAEKLGDYVSASCAVVLLLIVGAIRGRKSLSRVGETG